MISIARSSMRVCTAWRSWWACPAGSSPGGRGEPVVAEQRDGVALPDLGGDFHVRARSRRRRARDHSHTGRALCLRARGCWSTRPGRGPPPGSCRSSLELRGGTGQHRQGRPCRGLPGVAPLGTTRPRSKVRILQATQGDSGVTLLHNTGHSEEMSALSTGAVLDSRSDHSTRVG